MLILKRAIESKFMRSSRSTSGFNEKDPCTTKIFLSKLFAPRSNHLNLFSIALFRLIGNLGIYLAKFLSLIIISLFLASCDSSVTISDSGVTIEELQKVDPIDKGIRYPYFVDWEAEEAKKDGRVSSITAGGYKKARLVKITEVTDKDIRWGLKSVQYGGNPNIEADWYHACSSEEIRYDLSGDIISIIPLKWKLFGWMVDIGVGIMTGGEWQPITWVKEMFQRDDIFCEKGMDELRKQTPFTMLRDMLDKERYNVLLNFV